MTKIDWARYVEDYDAVCMTIPAYQENLRHLTDRIERWRLPSGSKVLDIGAGTGSFICAIGEKLPEAQFTHVDFSASMNVRARSKYDALSLEVDVIQGTLTAAEIPNYSQDLIICVNALYAMPSPQAMLRRIRRLLKPDGKFFIIDFGREMNLSRWSAYLFGILLRRRGFFGAIAWFWRYRGVLKQNLIGARAQRQGNYWLHSSEQFAHALEINGWYIEELTKCYLGDCDLAVCRPG